HEVGVTGPAGEAVDVEMVGDAGSGPGAEVESDVDPVRAIGPSDCGDGRVHPAPQFGTLVLGQIAEIGNGADGQHHEVAGSVGEGVEDGEAAFAPPDDEGFL